MDNGESLLLFHGSESSTVILKIVDFLFIVLIDIIIALIGIIAVNYR